MESIGYLLEENNIYEYGIIDFEKLSVINPRLLPKDIDIKSALVFLMPYRCKGVMVEDTLNAGLFARVRDYHAYFALLSKTLIPELEAETGSRVWGFADHSPINEKQAASLCGLGFIGKNSLLINKRYGSYVFIGVFLFSERLKEHTKDINGQCGSCSLCKEHCPTLAIGEGHVDIDACLSAISQKKKKSEEERVLLKRTKTVWGCDLCQLCCPFNRAAEFSDIEYFSENVITCFSAEIIDGMDEETYKNYAFSFREKKVISENCLTAEGNCDIIT